MTYVNASSDESQDLPMREANQMGIPCIVFNVRSQGKLLYGQRFEFLKYGIVINNVDDFKTFGKAMIIMENYHFFTRILRINYILPNLKGMKFLDFPFSWADIMEYWKTNNINKKISYKDFYLAACKEVFGFVPN